MEGERQNKPIDDKSNTSLPDTQIAVLDNSNSNTDPDLLSHSSKKQKKTEESHVLNSQNHQDILLNGKNADYRSFSTKNKKPSEPIRSNPIEEILHQAETVTSDLDSDEDEQKKKIAAAKKLLFPSTLATSFPEVVDTLRNERRQEFCPIYTDETPEQMTLRLAKRKPIGSLLAKRIRWDDLKRKREENERQAQVSVRYGPYGPIYSNQQASFSNTYGNMQNQPQQSFANPYEQYYAAVNSQYEQMAQMNRVQQEYNGFWPEYSQQSSYQNNNQIAQNPFQQQSQPYTYPMYYNNMNSINSNIPSSYTSIDYNTYLNNLRQPPPPPPSEPYPY